MTTNGIALVNVYYSESGYGNKLHYPPLGIGYIAQYLEEKNISYQVIDMGLGYSAKAVLTKLTVVIPSWIGISINSLLIKKTITFIKKIKYLLPETKIVIGGPHVTSQQEKVLSEIKFIDYAIAGEGERSFYKLVAGEGVKKIKGLIYKDCRGKIIKNPIEVNKDINQLPFPKFRKFELDKYQKKVIPLLSSRGCPSKCIFCQQSSLLGKKWRGVNPLYFLENITYWQKKGYNEFEILDDNFALDNKRLKEMVTLFKKENLTGIKLNLVGGLRVNSANTLVLRLLKKLNINLISLGIESYSNKVLRFIKKGGTEKKIREAIKNVTEFGFKVRLFFIIGFPYETKKSLKRFYKLILRYPIHQVRFFNLIPYEQTELMDWLRMNGKLLYLPDEYMNHFAKYRDIPVFEARYTMSPEDRANELKIARKIAAIIEKKNKL